MSLSKHIKDLRRQENLTQRDLADRAGVGIHFVRDLEQGKSSLRMDKVNEVLKLFGEELGAGRKDFHPGCAKKFFGTETAPEFPYTRANMHELANQVIRSSTSVTGVQAKMSLDVDRGGKNEPATRICTARTFRFCQQMVMNIDLHLHTTSFR